MTKIRYADDGTILAIGTAVDGKEIDEKTLPGDFLNTFALGKYKAQKNTDGTVTIIEVSGWVMPEKQVYTVDEIEKMSKDQLLALQAKLQEVIKKAV